MAKRKPMTFKELHDLIPQVVADNLGPLNDALEYAQKLHDAAVEEQDIRECQNLIDVVNTRIDKLAGEGDMLQKRIQQIAYLAHANQGF
jgi:uncharacterized membrane protein YccC